jgi:hypothetical protein
MFYFWKISSIFEANLSFVHPKKTFSEFICGKWYSSTGDYLKKRISRSTIQFFLLIKMNFWYTYSLSDNWDLDEFFEIFICGRWYIYLEQTIYHLFRLIIIPSGLLSSPVVDYDPQWLNIISSGWLLFQESTIQQTIFN